MNKDKKRIGIAFQIDEKSNELLTISARKSGRAKKQEALIRLQHHLKEFESISTVNDVRKRHKDS